MLRAPVDDFRLPRERDSRTQESLMVAAPFLKWAGGKRQLLAHIAALLPERIDTYFEPFLGGAAVFFRLAAGEGSGAPSSPTRTPSWSTAIKAIRDDVDGVIGELGSSVTTRDLYYRVRRRDPSKLSPTERAARLIYLNRCGYNGLYRVNSSGQFNVPFGRYLRPVICDEARLRAASAALKKARIVCGDFASTLKKVGPGDFVYLDPPYVPLSATSSFTAYAKSQFDADDQERLADVLRRLRRAEGAGAAVELGLSDDARAVSRTSTASIRSRRVGPSTPSVTAEVPSTRFWSAASTTRLRPLCPSLR